MLPTIRRQFEPTFAVLREFDRALNRAYDDTTSVGTDTFPVDVYEEQDTLVVEAELPGYDREQIDVNVEQGVLSIEANRTEKTETTDGEGKSAKRHVSERVTHVTRRFSLPSAYDTTQVDASLKDGVLTLRLPKREEVKPRKISVK